MARTAEITLDGTTYTIRAFNIGELEIIQKSGGDAWTVLRTALRRAEPKAPDANLIEPTPTELETAFATIMTLAGLKRDAPASPPAGAAPAA